VTWLDLLVVFVVSLLVTILVVVLMDLRLWVGLARDLYRHGRDNHRCGDPSCCSAEALQRQIRALER
jgi:hypothetical protein